MKNCPKCNLELPSEAHFCPRCMYEYPKTESKSKSGRSVKKKKRTFLIILLVFVLLIKFWPLIKLLIPKGNDNQIGGGNQQQVVPVFRTNDMTLDNPEVIHDFEDILFTDLDSVSQILGEEIMEAYPSVGSMVHEFESVVIAVSEDDYINCIYIDYLNAKNEIVEQYGIHGFNGNTSKEEVKGTLGAPDEIFEGEWYYEFGGERGMPSLRVVFDENDMVIALQYYTVQ